MSINALGAFAELGLGKLLGNKPPFLEVTAGSNEILSPTSLLQRVIGKALGTQNAARINEFLEQSGLSLSALPRPSQNENGASVYRFPTPERFWHSIGTFQQTGNTLPLAGSLTGNAPAQTPSFAATNPTSMIASKQGVTAQLERARLEPPTQTKDKKPALSSDKLTDSKGVQYSGRPDDLRGDEVFGVKVTVKPDDTRESLLREGNRAAVRAAGYLDPRATRIADARTAQLAEKGITGIVDVNTKTAGKTGETDDTELKNLRKAREMSYYVTGAEIKEFDRLDNQQQLQDAIAAGRPLNQEMIERSGVDREKLNSLLKEMNWQPIPTFTEAVDKLAAQKKADVLAQRDTYQKSASINTNYTNSKWFGMPDEQITAETKREATVDVQRQIGKGELQVRREDRPDSISPTNTPRWQTDAKLLIEKYMPGLAELNTPEGIKTTGIEAFTASFINARLFGATDFYVDQSRFHNERERGNAQIMSIAGSTIGELQNLTLAGKTVEAAMATTKVAHGVQILNESGKVGRLIVQALPSAATFGGLQTAKETVKAATGNSQGAQQAVTNVLRESTAGAVFGVFQPLRVGARVPAVVAGSYGVQKVFGASDKEAAMRALTDGLFSIAGGRGRAAEELAGKTIRVTGENGTATNIKVSVDAGRRIVLTEVAANVKADLQVKASAFKEAVQARVQNAGQYLRDKVTVTDVEVAQARKVIADYHSQQAKAPNLNASLYMPPIPDNPKVMGAYLTLAKGTIAEGATNFKEFSIRLTAKYGREVQPHLDKLYEKAAADTVVKANQADVQAFKAEQAKIKEGFATIADFRKANNIPKYDMNRDAQGQVTGTVAFSRANGQVEFGTNTTIGAKYLGTNNSELRKQAIQDIQTKLGKLEGAKYIDKSTKFLTHAEAESLLKLAQKNGGKLPAEVEMYSDRPTCFSCQGRDIDEPGHGLSLLAELYGVKKLTVRDSYGTTYIIRPNQRTEVIK